MKNTVMVILMIFGLSLNNLQAENIKALVIFPNQFGANSYFILEKLEEFGWEITTTGVNSVIQPCFWGDPVTVDVTIPEVDNITDYDCVVLCPMRWWQNPTNAYGDIINSPEAIDLFTTANEAGLILFATCAGVRVFAVADIIDGVNITGNANYQSEYIAAGGNFVGANIPPVIDGNIVTSTRGQYYWNQNPEAIKTAFENQINTK